MQMSWSSGWPDRALIKKTLCVCVRERVCKKKKIEVLRQTHMELRGGRRRSRMKQRGLFHFHMLAEALLLPTAAQTRPRISPRVRYGPTATDVHFLGEIRYF